ncbi:tetratricopeptide repeat-containing sensor histidine kinase [Mucilaginibacter myungsuensis]|uniref:histidine kinase n=2 Tax=Mucilaginibacter myungsuensis TaxID=649104 RepID=A0A929PWX3_9SPHI|nr:tetratricopeptide repeat-containing sensor histidine kinase [Mucilaginibacter myungsuensis]
MASMIYNGKYILPIIILLAFIHSCSKPRSSVSPGISAELNAAEADFYAGRHKKALRSLANLRPQLSDKKGALVRYYYLMAQHHARTADVMGLYVDSALALFPDQQAIDECPEGYYCATLAGGDHRLKTGQYATALDLFDKAKKTLPLTHMCDDGTLDSKLGMIYFNQKNYRHAASYWRSCYRKQGLCDQNVSAQTDFFVKQGTLNNIGVSYEQAGMMDSALHYYRLDHALINAAVGNDQISKVSVNGAYEVLYDNLGSVHLTQSKFDSARYYLNKCLSIPDPETDGMRIPPLLKLAELDILTGRFDTAYQSFRHSKKLLNKYADLNQNSAAEWKRLYAYYLSMTRQPDSVYHFLDQYIREQDTLDKNSTNLFRLNIQRELYGIQQQQSLNELSQRNKLKKLYLIGIGIIALLSLIIGYLVYRSLKKTRKSHQASTLHNQQLQQTLSELERVNQNHVRIMRVMAHDLRNPLSGMIGLSNVLQLQDDLSADSQHMVQLIETTGNNAMNMINELLKSGLADEKEELEMVKQPIDINALLQNSIELLQFKADEKKQRILFEPSAMPAVVLANQEKIWRAFNNLIGNAVKFSHIGGEIKVGVKTTGDTVLISIADQGVGIPEEDRESIFEMFTPAKKVGTDGEHPFGLGLSISKRIIGMHQGRIWLDSEVNVGTTFYVELPTT